MNSLFGVLDELCKEAASRESLERILTLEDPDISVMALMSFLGERFRCQRVYVFEAVSGNVVRNTYEWCAEGVSSQKDLLQNESRVMLDWWFRMFETRGSVTIEDMEEIRVSHPEIYACLITQDIHSLLVVPIRNAQSVIGFWGVDNPADCRNESLHSFLGILSKLIAILIERREHLNKLRYISTHDQLTGCLNRNALRAAVGDTVEKSRGLIYCDVSDLKRINDKKGHEAGDQLLIYWCDVLREIFEGYDIFRVGGDEFLVLCPEISREEMRKRVSSLALRVERDAGHLAVGSYWSDDPNETLGDHIAQAEASMYKSKEQYYNQLTLLSERGRERRKSTIRESRCLNDKSDFGRYIQSNYFDPESFFRSVSQTSFYPFMGDLKTKIFYISDEMKNRFGFTSNWVPNMVTEWEKRICDTEDLDLFRRDIRAVLNREKKHHELCYRVRDVEENDVWVFSRGEVAWDEQEGLPIFLSGGFYLQDHDFTVDSVSNFPRENAAIMKIGELWNRKEPVTLIGFALNHFAEINEIRGRYRTDLLLREISDCLKREFDGKLRFYRMDGLRFAALVNRDARDEVEALARRIRECVMDVYYSNNIAVRVPCSAGIICIEDPEEYFGERPVHPRELLGDMIGLVDVARSCPEEEFVVHSAESLSLHRNRAQMLMKMGQDIQNNFENFRLVMQPAVHTGDGRVTSAEVLLRWRFGEEDIPAEMFVDILEKNRMIIPVGRWVCEQVVRILRRITAYRPDFRLACNVSYHQIMDQGFIPFVRSCLKKYDVKGESLILEITETHYDDSPAQLLKFIEECRKMGIGIAMDDFGNGYASLAFLLKYPADIVKLDKSLLDGILHSQDHVNFLSSIVFACHKFGRLVCAEGVEEEREMALVKGTGCDMIQGFYYYKPMEVDSFFAMLARSERYLPVEETVL